MSLSSSVKRDNGYKFGKFLSVIGQVSHLTSYLILCKGRTGLFAIQSNQFSLGHRRSSQRKPFFPDFSPPMSLSGQARDTHGPLCNVRTNKGVSHVTQLTQYFFFGFHLFRLVMIKEERQSFRLGPVWAMRFLIFIQ